MKMIKVYDNKYFMLYSCCIPVKGFKRSIICDLQKRSFIYIPNSIYDLLQYDTNLEHDEGLKERDDIIEIINYLIENEMGFFTSNPENFPSINFKNNDLPITIKNIIIDFDNDSKHDLKNIINQISDLRCTTIELRFYCNISKELFTEYLNCFYKSTIRSINIALKYSDWTTEEILSDFFKEFDRLKQVIIHGSKKDIVSAIINIIYTKEAFENEMCCGNISPHYFTPQLDFYKESLSVNNCLDKKISIDKQGRIKNCPSMKTSFGNINLTKIVDAIKNKEFQKLWGIKKDDIEICKDCEFRYICLDCRAYISENDISFSKPKKCKYDPYTNIWT